MTAPTVEPRQLADRAAAAPVELIDVRTPVEFREVHADRARNISLDRLDPAALPADRPIFVICKSGSRGRQACEKLRAAGLDAFNIEGGTLAWIECGLRVVRGKKAMSLERQVRIAASCCSASRSDGWSILRSSDSPRSWAPASSSPESRTRAAWE